MNSPDGSIDRRTVAWLALWSVVAVGLAAATALGPLEGIPHVSDELSYTWQARVFAAGARFAPAPDNPSMWLHPFWVMEEARAYSPFPWGWPLLLSLGERLGAGWLVNVLLGGALPPILWALSRRWTDDATARLAAAVVALSPGVWIMAASRMSHTSVVVALGLAAVAVSRRRGGRDGLWPLLAGAAVAYVVTARQLDAALLGGPLLLWGLWRYRSPVAWMLLVGLPGVAAGLVLWDNLQLTGHASTFPMGAWLEDFAAGQGPGGSDRPGCNRLGFGADVGCHSTFGSWGHTPQKALFIGLQSLRRLDFFLLGVPGSLLAVALGAWRLRATRGLKVAAVLTVTVIGAYALYFSQGAAYGARFWHPLYLVLPTLVAAGLGPLLGRWTLPLLGALVVAGASRILPDLGEAYWCVDGELTAYLESEGIDEGVIFMKAEGKRPASWPGMGVYVGGCDPLLEAGDGFHLNDPMRPASGLQVRHALPDAEQTELFMHVHHQGQPAWLVVHDVEADVREVRALGVPAP